VSESPETMAERAGKVPTLVIAFPDQDRMVESVDFVAFWRDDFGTVHFYATEGHQWEGYFDRVAAEDAELVEHEHSGDIAT
jgi:hypothetical protein